MRQGNFPLVSTRIWTNWKELDNLNQRIRCSAIVFSLRHALYDSLDREPDLLVESGSFFCDKPYNSKTNIPYFILSRKNRDLKDRGGLLFASRP